MTTPKNIKARVFKHVFLTSKIVFLTLELPCILDYIAGQFISFKYITKEKKNILRPYSIINPPNNSNKISFTIKIIDGGVFTPYIATLKKGDTIDIIGPFGNFIINKKNNKPISFIATTVGVAPLYCMLKDLLDNGYSKSINLYLGFRYIQDIFWENELLSLKNKYSNFQYFICISKPETLWLGLKGRVTDNIKIDKNYQYYICGNSQMIKSVKDLLLKNSITDIHEEIYF